MKIVFLDFDGVLNSYEFHRSDRKLVPEGKRSYFDPVAVARLNEILDRSGAKIVCSTSWRRANSQDGLQKLLSSVGCTGTVIDTTPIHYGGPRGKEIQAWLRRNPGHRNFVILDDWDEMQCLPGQHILTQEAVGLQDRDIERALTIMEETYEGDFGEEAPARAQV